MSRNWESYGIEWEAGEVKKESGATFPAEIIRVVDLAKFASTIKAANGDVMAILNASNSIKVMCQDVCRTNPKDSRDAKREKMWNRLTGVRNTPRAAQPKVMLADGTIWQGDNADDFVAAQTAALFKLGLPTEAAETAAKAAAANLKF